MAKKKKRKLRAADVADRHELYQESVQDSEFELDFVQDTFKAIRKRKAETLREDFCGTARSACAWVQRNRRNQAWGVDLDAEVLDWGRERNLKALKPRQRERVTLLEADVLKAKTPPVDVVLAFNFSYWILQQRAQLLKYLRSVRKSLASDGIMFLDYFGGYEAYKTQTEKHKLDGFTYEWEQHSYNGITGEMQCYIHFSFPDKSRMDKAFSYCWRLWGAHEIHDLLEQAGFSKVRWYVQRFDDDTGVPVDEFEETTHTDDHACWIAYIVAEK